MQAIFVSLLVAAFHGGIAGLGGALTNLSIAQWVTLAEGAAEAVAPELASHLGLKPSGNTIGALFDGALKTATDAIVREKVGQWLSANAEAAMRLQPGMGTDY